MYIDMWVYTRPYAKGLYSVGSVNLYIVIGHSKLMNCTKQCVCSLCAYCSLRGSKSLNLANLLKIKVYKFVSVVHSFCKVLFTFKKKYF